MVNPTLTVNLRFYVVDLDFRPGLGPVGMDKFRLLTPTHVLPSSMKIVIPFSSKTINSRLGSGSRQQMVCRCRSPSTTTPSYEVT